MLKSIGRWRNAAGGEGHLCIRAPGELPWKCTAIQSAEEFLAECCASEPMAHRISANSNAAQPERFERKATADPSTALIPPGSTPLGITTAFIFVRSWMGTRLVLMLLLMAAASADALEPTTPLASYGRQSWVMENGLPQNTVQVLLETRDGFVWMGTEVGLVRFDGISFQIFDQTTSPALPGNDVHALLETRDGALWIGTSEGLARWRDGKVDSYTTANRLADNDIRSLAQGEEGVLFAWTSQGLARFEENRFVDATSSTHFPPGAISAVTSNGQNEIWVTAGEDMAIYRQGRWEAAHMAPPIAGGGVQYAQAFQ